MLSDFADLYAQLDGETSSNARLRHMEAYFLEAEPIDGLWGLWILSGQRLSLPVKRKVLRELLVELTALPEWLIEESYDVVADFAETASLLLEDRSERVSGSLAAWMDDHLPALKRQPEETQKQQVSEVWTNTSQLDRLVWTKLITGGLRVGVSRKSALKAYAKAHGLDSARLEIMTTGSWKPSQDRLNEIHDPNSTQTTSDGRPYPFCLAHPLETIASLSDLNDYQLEWKWDGIRAQLIRREDRIFLWSRGEELINDSFPDIVAIGDSLPNGTALDGEIVVMQDDQIGPFAELQKRLRRKKPTKGDLAQRPAAFIAYDLIENDGKDLRERPLRERRSRLESLSSVIELSQTIDASSVEELENLRSQAREHRSEGLMIKRRDSSYRSGRHTDVWWKFKVDPLTIDAVLIAAQRGSGRRAGLYTDYTFGVWKNEELVSFAKAYSGLSDKEIAKVDRFIKGNILERFGPVRTVTPELVFEIGFDSVSHSKRHKCGYAVRFPRILRWRQDKPVAEADRIEALAALAGDRK